MTAAEFQALPEKFATEDKMQAALVRWMNKDPVAFPLVQGRFFSVPNAARRSFALASQLKSTGMKAGTPDLVLYGPSGRVAFLELKNGPKSKPSPEQLDFHLSLRLNGHEIHVAHSIEAAKQIITEFYSLP